MNNGIMWNPEQSEEDANIQINYIMSERLVHHCSMVVFAEYNMDTQTEIGKSEYNTQIVKR